MKNLTSLIAGSACLLSSLAQAQVRINSTETFDAVPPATSWSTRSVPGAGGAPTTLVDLTALVQTNTAALINTALGTSGTVPPSGNGLARQNSTAKYAQTLPTGNAATILMATITNSTGVNLPTPKISYDFLVPSAIAGEDPETAGHIVYYSLTGAENSWVQIPELTSAQPPVAGALFLDLNLGAWSAGSLLYIIWVDDNGGPAGDGSFAIDNFTISGELPPPPTVATQPSNTTNLVRRTVSLSVVANGVGIQYVWNKVGAGAIDPLINPSAATRTLVITNALESDTGEYFVSISSPYGSVDSTSAHIQIDPDTFPPRLMAARLGANPNQIILVVDEELCNNGEACGTVFTDLPILTYIISTVDNPEETLGVFEASSQNTTNIILTLDPSTPWVAGTAYRITISHDNNGISDLGGIVVPAGTFVDTLPTISFQQNVGGYAGTQDAGIHSGSAGTADGANPIVNVDSDDGGVRQALLRFDNLFGASAGLQVPSGAIIRQATLTINQTDNGNPVNFYRMLTAWDQSSVTWDSLSGGLAADGVEATTAIDVVTPGLNGVVGLITMDVTASVQAWAAGQPNYGWAIIPTGGDGWRWNSSESAVPPTLSVIFEVVPCNGVPTITANPPTATSVNEGASISIAVGVGNTCASTTFEWIKGNLPGTVVPGATGPTLSIVGAVPGDAGTYRLRATNPAGSVTSNPVNLSVPADTIRPVLTRAVSVNNTTVVLNFSKTLGAGASATSHYTVSGATVTAAVVANSTVTLTTSARTAGNSTLTISGVTDNRVGANLINPNPTTVTLTTVQVIDTYASTWSYNTNNLDANADWTTTGGTGWLDGAGLFGTETTAATVAAFPTPIATVIPPANAANEFLTSYYRKTVNLPALAAGMSYAISYIVDDGAVFFLDGVEIGRYNLPAGALTYLSVAPGAGTEGVQFALPFTATAGNHVIAVSVHQNANTSTDTVFGAQVIAIPTASPALAIAKSGTNTVVSWNSDSSWELIGSPNVAGPYNAVAGAPFRTFTSPTPTAQTNEFYRLRYRP